jgi:hypothetical protein
MNNSVLDFKQLKKAELVYALLFYYYFLILWKAVKKRFESLNKDDLSEKEIEEKKHLEQTLKKVENSETVSTNYITTLVSFVYFIAIMVFF